MNFKCGRCGFYVAEKQACMVYARQVDPSEDGCSKFNHNPTRCEICEKPLITKFIDNGHVLCSECCAGLISCNGCDYILNCDFETNPSALPKVVMQTINQGNMVMQTQVRNPERIDITCKNGCKCFDEENGCLRQFGYCGNHNHTWPVVQSNEENN